MRTICAGGSASSTTVATKRSRTARWSPAKARLQAAPSRLTYRRAVPGADGSSTTVSFEDWFVQIDEETLMVWASLQKLILPVGSMSVYFDASLRPWEQQYVLVTRCAGTTAAANC